MVCLGFEPRAAGWKAQTNPLSYGGNPPPIAKVCLMQFFWGNRFTQVGKSNGSTVKLLQFYSTVKLLCGQWKLTTLSPINSWNFVLVTVEPRVTWRDVEQELCNSNRGGGNTITKLNANLSHWRQWRPGGDDDDDEDDNVWKQHNGSCFGRPCGTMIDRRKRIEIK